MDILFIGGVFPKDREKQIFNDSKGNMQYAANALQWNIIDGIEQNIGKAVKVLNAVFVGSYPKRYKKLFIKAYKWEHREGANDYNIAFLNLWGLKHISRAINLSKYIKKWAKKDINKTKIIIAYSFNSPFLNAIKTAKKINPKIQTCLVVPDLPEYMNMNDNLSLLYKIFKTIDYNSMHRNVSFVDKFVLLTKQMAYKINIGGKKYVVVEGMVNAKELTRLDRTKSVENKIVLYAGTLAKKYGVMSLVNSIKYITSPNYRLIICGDGEAKHNIIDTAKIDNRIIFKGIVTREKALELQQQATVVINPRPNNDEFTKYSFPSKTMEYMLSGRPVLMYKLDGIPDEYDQYLYYINGNQPKDIASKIMEVCEKPQSELNNFGEKARQFVLKNKNCIVQAKKIIDMINEE